MIEITNLAKIYPNQKGVKGISFSVAKGEIMGLLGPNGAGKTTTMRIITGYMYPTSGTVKIGEYDIYEKPREARSQIGYLPENPPLYPEMSVLGYLQFAARLKGVKKDAVSAEVKRVLELTGLGGVKQQLIASLSKGYKQRVGLAQALLNSPPVLVLDEPTIGLDPKQIIEIRNLIKGLAQEHTVILSSHILPEVNAICSRVAIIAQGHLVALDTPEGLSQQLRSGNRMEIEARGTKEKIEKLLASLKPLKEISYTGAGKSSSQAESHCFALQGQKDSDIREDLFKTFAKADISLLEMHSVGLSLEEIFLQLTTTESDEAETKATHKNEMNVNETTGKAGIINE